MTDERRVLPVLPLRGLVLFPGHRSTVAISRPTALKALEIAMRGERHIFAVAQRADSDEPSCDTLYSMGVVARVLEVQMTISALQVTLAGESRATAVDYRPGEYLSAVAVPVQQIQPVNPQEAAFVALYREVRARAIELGTRRGLAPEVLNGLVASVNDPGDFCDLVAHYLEIETPEKQQLLETLGVEMRLRRILLIMQRELDLATAQEEIKNQVAQELGGRQREFYLREQLKAIRRELGEAGDKDENRQLEEKLRALQLPEEARKEVDRELARLGHSNAESMEAQVIRTYLQWIAELPWQERTEDRLDLSEAAAVLDEDHYGLRDVKDRVLEFLSVRLLNARQVLEDANRTGSQSEPNQGTPEPSATGASPAPGELKARALAKGPILLFLGPPGVGKTSVAQSIARALGRKYVRAALGGIRDEADIRGHRRTYVGALPGRIIQGMKQAGSKNPVFLLDEIDKLGAGIHGDPASALLEVLDPAQNQNFTDHYLGVPFDLSEVLFVATGNFGHQIPGPLNDRLELIEFAGYTEREKAEIAKRYLIRRKLAEASLGRSGLEFEDDAILTLISAYTHESGVRQLERQIGAIIRKLSRKLAGGEPLPPQVSSTLVRELLGRPRVRPERIANEDQIGVATGLYYTPAGGDIMFVEAAVRTRHRPEWDRVQPMAAHEQHDAFNRLFEGGDVSLILTGQLGEVMRESARAALTYVMTHLFELGVPDVPGSLEIHVHVPAGAIPKDGPSAGVTIATALASAVTGRPVRRDTAMTGEITLRGRVLPIGGVKEKVLGAQRAGTSHVILPLENQPDAEALPEEVKGALSFQFVESLEELLPLALLPPVDRRALTKRRPQFRALGQGSEE
jgi:ATP-dependent Lon protease